MGAAKDRSWTGVEYPQKRIWIPHAQLPEENFDSVEEAEKVKCAWCVLGELVAVVEAESKMQVATFRLSPN